MPPRYLLNATWYQQSFLGDSPLTADVPSGIAGGSSGYSRLEGLSIAEFKIPVDDKGTTLIPYRGNEDDIFTL